MRSWGRIVPAVLFLFHAGVAGAADNAGAGEAFLREVVRKYAAVRTLSAGFRQEIPLQNLGIVRKAHGRVYFERPLKMRWDYRGKPAQVFLADGRHFYFRPEDAPQVLRKKIDESSLGGRIPLLLLFGKGDISDRFRVEGMIPRKEGTEKALRLVPRGDGAPDVRRIDLVVGSGDLLIREVHLYDKLGGANHLYLEETALDPSLPAGLFRFVRPEGVEVVDG
jgi:outer membrane lipoprotein carrier protein